MANIYVGSTKYTAVAQWAASTTYAVGNVVRQLAAPAVGSERCFRVSAITTGISNTVEPAWTLTANGTTADSGVTWTECTGQAIYNGDGGGSAWGAPHARILNAIASTWAAAGDTVYVSNNHAATQSAALTLNGVGSAAAPIKIICVSDLASPPTATATTASESTTGASTIVINGLTAGAAYGYVYGITFNAGSGASVASIAFNNGLNTGAGAWYFDSCTFNLSNTASTSGFSINNSVNQPGNCFAEFSNCKFTFGATAQKLNIGDFTVHILGGSIAATGSVPTTAFAGINLTCGEAVIRDCDISTVTGTLCASSNGNTFYFENCKLGAGVTPGPSASQGPQGLIVKLHNCDSAATNYRYYYKNYMATVQQETTIVRTGGATDGTTPLSWNMSTSANSSYYTPFVSDEIAQWNNTTGSSKTATVYLTSNTALTNNDVWLEIEYLGSSTSPLGSLVTTKLPLLTTATALTADASTWGGAITNKYSISVSFTPQMKGPVKARIYMAKASTQIYLDPLLTVV